MAADIQALRDNYLLAAELEGGESLNERLAWLNGQFRATLTDTEEVSAVSIEGRSTNMVFRGSTPEERRSALRLAIAEIKAQIAGDLADRGALLNVRLAFPPITLN